MFSSVEQKELEMVNGGLSGGDLGGGAVTLPGVTGGRDLLVVGSGPIEMPNHLEMAGAVALNSSNWFRTVNDILRIAGTPGCSSRGPSTSGASRAGGASRIYACCCFS